MANVVRMKCLLPMLDIQIFGSQLVTLGEGVKRCSLVGGSVPLEADFEAAKDSRSF